jgi:hypothetical protein
MYSVGRQQQLGLSRTTHTYMRWGSMAVVFVPYLTLYILSGAGASPRGQGL